LQWSGAPNLIWVSKDPLIDSPPWGVCPDEKSK
jgi:hypothetical protein